MGMGKRRVIWGWGWGGLGLDGEEKGLGWMGWGRGGVGVGWEREGLYEDGDGEEEGLGLDGKEKGLGWMGMGKRRGWMGRGGFGWGRGGLGLDGEEEGLGFGEEASTYLPHPQAFLMIFAEVEMLVELEEVYR